MEKSLTLVIVFAILSCTQSSEAWYQKEPNGNYAFLEAAPGATLPSVRKPPYTHTTVTCASLHQQPVDLSENLCGDLNKEFIPLNPMGQMPLGQSYPFDLFRNKTLEFLRQTVPFLKSDSRLPRVTKYVGPRPIQPPPTDDVANSVVSMPALHRLRRDLNSTISSSDFEQRIGKARTMATARENFCSDSSNIMCKFWDLLSGIPFSAASKQGHNANHIETNEIDQSGPPTPCPSVAEYATPLFARNYQGIWRYIMQIPHEGYFTQTVEIVKCLQRKCKYLEGACLSSSRWVSFLAAEIFYPNSFMPSLPPPPHPSTPPAHFDAPVPPVYDFQNFQQYLNTRAGVQVSRRRKPIIKKEEKPQTKPEAIVCDGYDKQGCFQIRMFYDWFLVPGACKCWRQNGLNVFH